MKGLRPRGSWIVAALIAVLFDCGADAEYSTSGDATAIDAIVGTWTAENSSAITLTLCENTSAPLPDGCEIAHVVSSQSADDSIQREGCRACPRGVVAYVAGEVTQPDAGPLSVAGQLFFQSSEPSTPYAYPYSGELQAGPFAWDVTMAPIDAGNGTDTVALSVTQSTLVASLVDAGDEDASDGSDANDVTDGGADVSDAADAAMEAATPFGTGLVFQRSGAAACPVGQ